MNAVCVYTNDTNNNWRIIILHLHICLGQDKERQTVWEEKEKEGEERHAKGNRVSSF